MAVASLTWLFILLLHTLFFVLSAAQPDFVYPLCGSEANYTVNSTYQNNLNNLLSNFSSNIDPNSLFYSASIGETPDRVNALALCRGDTQLEDCRSCVLNSTRKITQTCPHQKEAIGPYDQCMLRYSNASIFGVMATRPAFYMRNTENVSGDVEQFNWELRGLFEDLRGQATSGRFIPGLFAAGNTTLSRNFLTMYGLVQCSQDLSPDVCGKCLVEAMNEIPSYSIGFKGGRVYWPSCNIRFEIYPFYNQSAIRFTLPFPPPHPASPPPGAGGKDDITRTIIIIVVPIVAVVILSITACKFVHYRRRRMRMLIEQFDDVADISTVESLQHDFSTTRAATDDFSNANKLGQGGFGVVYKGILANRQEIAVKRLSSRSRQGELEFKTEVLLVAKLQHRNLVRFLGFCIAGFERLLIYEYLPNSSLDKFIFDQAKRAELDWDKRYKIIGGITRGLLYLHEDSRLRVIHRDLKASNVLLDEEMNAKIADFGMARLFVLNETQGNTSKIIGTYGYMAPEYAMHGLFSVKSDVFSFGVLVLEVISGQRNRCFQIGESVDDLLSYAWKSWQDGSASNVIDPTLRANPGPMQEMMRCMHIGLLCVQENAVDRPTMASVLAMLSSISMSLPVPSEPAFFMHSKIDPEMPLLSEQNYRIMDDSQSSKGKSINEASITELCPR